MTYDPLPILGYYGHNNAGDEAFKLVFSQYLGEHPHVFRRRFEAQEELPLAMFGGGAIVNSYFMRNLQHVQEAHLIGVSLPYGNNDLNDLEPFRSKIANLLLRSRRDVQAARAKGYDAEFMPDMVFSLQPQVGMTVSDLIDQAVLPPRGFSPERKKLFVFLSGDYWVDPINGDSDKFRQFELLKTRVAKALDQMVNDFDIIMPSMSVWYNARDYMFAGDVLKRMRARHRVCLVERYVDAADLISVLASEDCAVLSMKYHGLVFGLLSDRPVVNIGTTRKTVDLMEDFGIPDMTFDAKKGHSDRLVEMLKKTQNAEFQGKITTTAAGWRSDAETIMRRAINDVVDKARGIAPLRAKASV